MEYGSAAVTALLLSATRPCRARTVSTVREWLRYLQPDLAPFLPADVRAPTPISWPRAVEIPGS